MTLMIARSRYLKKSDREALLASTLSVSEVAELTGRSRRTIQQHAQRGRIPGAVLDDEGRWRIPKTVIQDA